MADEYTQILTEEDQYLSETVALIDNIIETEMKKVYDRKASIISSRRDMWENTGHSSRDFTKLTEMNQHMFDINNQVSSYISTLNRMDQLKRMKGAPYFGRFDFKEEDSDETEKIYIGIANLIDENMHEIRVYDWRAPISSIFYQYELGDALYNSPAGTVRGAVSLKRQYKILNSRLKYYFDCSIKIDDEMLQEILSRNSSDKMKSIVETIQKEQDKAIRDEENELLIVQGTAGSGKTSIAMHRIAYLLYQGVGSGLTSDNILVISPNSIFSSYISSVLPELGEENVNQIIFDQLALSILGDNKKIQDRNSFLESVTAMRNPIERQACSFKGSRAFIEMLDRFVAYFERNMIDFEDIYYNGRIIQTKQELKNFFLNNKIQIPITQRLKRIENMIFDKIRPLQKSRLDKIEKVVQKSDVPDFEVKSLSRLLSFKQFKVLSSQIKRFTNSDYLELYKYLFNNKNTFRKLSDGLKLPENIDDIIERTKTNMETDFIHYEDRSALMYLKLKLEGSNFFPDIRHVLVDEAQDYYPIDYEILKLLLKYCKFTILGDINQTIEKGCDMSIYDHIMQTLCKRKSLKLILSKSYRSSVEINNFNRRMLNDSQSGEFFERHGAEPKIVFNETKQMMIESINHEIKACIKEGYETIAIICRNCFEAKSLYNMIDDNKKIKLIIEGDEKIEKGIMIIPSYMAKGLEFDTVLVYDVSSDNYYDELDKRLLYIACTRALHKLTLFYTGNKCDFI